MVVNSKLNGCYYPFGYLINFIRVVYFTGDTLCSVTQKHRPQSTELGVIFSCVEIVKGFQDVENWAVRDLEGRN